MPHALVVPCGVFPIEFKIWAYDPVNLTRCSLRGIL